ncbi:MAG: Uma2 family endonuclease, partial [Microcystis sp.]
DRKAKKELYQHTFRTPEYFWFDPNTLEWQGFTLIEGQYQPITPNENGYLWSKQLGLYLGIFANKLRYFTESGELVPTPQESARQERLAKEQERLAKEREQQRAEKLAQKLRELGINPDEIA